MTRAYWMGIFDKITPAWVFLFDQFNLPSSAPILHLSLAGFRLFARWKIAVPDQAAAIILSCKTRKGTSFVLPSASQNIVSMADIKRPILHTGRDVNIKHRITPDTHVRIMFWLRRQPLCQRKLASMAAGWSVEIEFQPP